MCVGLPIPIIDYYLLSGKLMEVLSQSSKTINIWQIYKLHLLTLLSCHFCLIIYIYIYIYIERERERERESSSHNFFLGNFRI